MKPVDSGFLQRAFLMFTVSLASCCSTALLTAQDPAPTRPAPARGEADSFRPDQSQLPAKAPEGAIVLFDGGNEKSGADHLFVNMAGEAPNWPIEDGALVSTQKPGNINHLCSRLHFRDADIHVEFLLPEKGAGNSGIYIHGNFELQIINSHEAKELTQQEMGSVYGFAPPLVNAAKPPGQWQVYDIRYRAPRRNAADKVETPGAITAWLNGQLVQNGVTFEEPRSTFHPYRHGVTDYLKTIYPKQKATATGPLFLQDHNSPVRFRNVWVKPLDDEAFLYEPRERGN
ncbi:MAG: DUF1080 domain-containing protein [Planctomycetota bacterium]